MIATALLAGCETNMVINVITKDCTFAEPIYYDFQNIDRETEAQILKHNANYECFCEGNVNIDSECKETTL